MKKVKSILNKIFIDGLSGMALGLFATLIIGTILAQIAAPLMELSGFWGTFGKCLFSVSKVAQALMGAGIGVGIACKYKESPLVAVSAATCGMVGAFATPILSGSTISGSIATFSGPGEPFSAFIAALVGIFVGHLVAGKTKLDIILTPIVTIISGCAVGLLVGPYVARGVNWLGGIINWGTEQQPIIMGIVVSVLMGIMLTLPISSAAIGIGLGLSGIAAGAATVGCCANMIGFAVASFRENKLGGLVSQGVGTSMLQMPNIVRKPIIWLPAIISSAVLGPISTTLLVMQNNKVGSGMGTAGLVGPITSYQVMTSAEIGEEPWFVILKIVLMYIVFPAIISIAVSEIMRKIKWIKPGDMKLDV